MNYTEVTPSAEMERKISKAKSLLILEHPFFGMTVSRRELKYTTDIPAVAGVNAVGQIFLNPELVEPMSVRNIMFLLAHEAEHYMLLHPLRKQHRDVERWLTACDMVVNDILIDGKVGDFIEGGVTYPGARDLSVEQMYELLPVQESSQDGSGSGGDQEGGGIGPDLILGGRDDQANMSAIEAGVKLELLHAAKAAKAMGKLPASIERLVDAIVNVKTPWHEILALYMQARIKDGYSWSRPNRRFISGGLYLPGYDYVPQMGEVVIGVDTSGSIGQRELDEFNGHVNAILERCNPEKVTVIYCDSSVNHVDEFLPENFPVRLEPYGGGGTSFLPVFKYVEDNDLKPEVLVYLTDGYGDQDRVSQPEYPTVWLTTGSTEFPWGLVVEFEPEEEK